MGGALVLASTATVSVASHRREARQASKEAASRAIQRILSSGSEEEAAEAGSLGGGTAQRRADAAAAEAWEEDGWGGARPQAKQGESPASRGMAGWPEGPLEPSGGKPPDDH